MLGANAPTESRCQAQHCVCRPVVLRVQPEHVYVQVAIGDVAEDHAARLGGSRGDRPSHPVLELGEARQGKRDIQLMRHALGVDRFRMTFPIGPQAFALGPVGGDRARKEAARGVQGAHKLGQRVAARSAFEQEVRRERLCKRQRQTSVFADEVDAIGKEDLSGLQRWCIATYRRNDRESRIDAIDREQRDGTLAELRHQPEPRSRNNGQRPFASGQQAGQVVAGVVLREAWHAAEDRAFGRHRLDAADLRAHRAVTHHPDAAGVRGDHAADGRAIPRGEVHAEVPAGRTHVLLEVAKGNPG